MSNESPRYAGSVGERKERLFEGLEGTLLELGAGAGANIPHLPPAVRLVALEPNPFMHPYLLNRALAEERPLALVQGTAEALPFPDESLDAVLSTLVLCSVGELDRVLGEVVRVLKPEGRFLFLEHVVDKNNFARRTTQKVMPYTPWRIFAEGCRPARDIGKAIEKSGFSNVEYTNYMQEGSGIITSITRPHIVGYAIK